MRRVPGTTESAMEEYQEYQYKIGPTGIINNCLGVVAEIYTSSPAKQKKNVIQAEFTSAAVHSRTADERMAAHHRNKPSSDRCHLLFRCFLLERLLSRATLLTTDFTTCAVVGTGAGFVLGLLLLSLPASHRSANRWQTTTVVPWSLNRMRTETDNCK